MLNGRLRDQDYPFAFGNAFKERPTDLIIVILGGVTCEEAYSVAEINKTNPGTRIILGGSSIINSNTFLKNIAAANGVVAPLASSGGVSITTSTSASPTTTTTTTSTSSSTSASSGH
ncbi:hypothetical protein Pelo_16187 [Pelomyxa schiedti]|nr:hypothetical protein Pelo_16187 [Pelomyxa schiedti]